MSKNDIHDPAPHYAAMKGHVVTERHARWCREHGHSQYVGKPADNWSPGRCPRCGELTVPAANFPDTPSVEENLTVLEDSGKMFHMNTSSVAPAVSTATPKELNMNVSDLPTVKTAAGDVVVYPKNCDACNKRINKVNRSEDVTRCKTCFNTPDEDDVTVPNSARFAAPRCVDCEKRLSNRNRSGMNDKICTDCFEIAGLENSHSDGEHDDLPTLSCPLCVAEVGDNNDSAVAPKKAKADNTRSWNSHATCNHESTPAARRTCRTMRAPLDDPTASTTGTAKAPANKASKKSKTTKKRTAADKKSKANEVATRKALETVGR